MTSSFLLRESELESRFGFAGRSRFPRMFGFDKSFQIVQAGRPEDAVLLDPGINRAERLRIELVNSTAAFAVFADQVCAAQQAQVLGDCGTRDGERFGDLDRKST